jgi:hypothetical protein
LERRPLDAALLDSNQNTGGLGADFNRNETADSIGLSQGPVFRGGRFRKGFPVIRREQSVHQPHTIAVRDQLI